MNDDTLHIEIPVDEVDATLGAIAHALIALSGDAEAAAQLQRLYFTIRAAQD